MNKPVYVHYGTDTFDKDLVTSIKKVHPSKPDRGIWASRIDCDYGWKQFCLNEGYHIDSLKRYFYFTIKDDAKILEIQYEEDILDYIIHKEGEFLFSKTSICDSLNLRKLYNIFDGIELFTDYDWDNIHSGIFNA